MATAGDIEKLSKSAESCLVAVYSVKSESNDSLASINTPSPSPPPELDVREFVPPDGGFIAWAQVVVGFLTNAVTWGFPTMFGVYQHYYISTTGMDATAVPWIGSVQIFLAYFMCTVSGRLSDAGYAKSTLLAGATLAVLGTLATSFCTRFWQVMLAQGICTGLGLGLTATVSVPAISSYFQKKRSIALSISTTGTSVGGGIFPAIVQYLMPKIGFAWAVRCAALVAFVLLANAYVLLKPRPVRRVQGEKEPMVDWAAFKELPYNLLAVSSFLFYWAAYFAFYYFGTYAQDVLHLSYASSSSVLIISTASGIPMRVAAGFVADYYLGTLNTYVLSIVFFGAAHFVWMGASTAPALYAFAVLFGFGTGATQGIWPGTVVALTPDPSKVGVRFGMVCTIAAFAALAGPPTASAILQGSGGAYLGAQVWAAVVILVAAAIMAGARLKLSGRRLWVKV